MAANPEQSVLSGGRTCLGVALFRLLGLDAARSWGIAMKQSREVAPLWVWLTFGVLGLGGLAYAAGYIMIEDILAFVR